MAVLRVGSIGGKIDGQPPGRHVAPERNAVPGEVHDRGGRHRLDFGHAQNAIAVLGDSQRPLDVGAADLGTARDIVPNNGRDPLTQIRK